MGIEGSISWYQKKIGTYDNQLWEKTVEGRILHGIANVKFRKGMRLKSGAAGVVDSDDNKDLLEKRMKDTQVEPEFIDIDLVRGSSFTKAKPKHGFMTVARLGTLRFLLLPLYAKWWVQQTSGKIFLLLLGLYTAQLVNIAVYSYNVNKLPDDSTEYVLCTEIIVPIVMMWVLSTIHSQIVSTQSDTTQTPCRKQKRHKIRRRRKPTKGIGLRKPANIDGYTCKNESSDSVRSTEKVRLPKCVIFQPEEDAEGSSPHHIRKRINSVNRLIDDGFESFNGNGSSLTDTTEEFDGVRGRNDRHSRVEDVDNVENGSPLLTIRSRFSPKINIDVSTPMTDSNRPKKSWKSFQSNTKPNADSSSCDSEECEPMSSPEVEVNRYPLLNDATTSATEWMGGTTNTEDGSYSSECVLSDNENILACTPTAILSPCCALSDKVTCTIWKNHEPKKIELSVFDISCEIIARVEEMAESSDYFIMGVICAIILSLLPTLCRLSNDAIMESPATNELTLTVVEISGLVLEKLSGSIFAILDAALGTTLWERTVMIIAALQRCILACLFFFLLSVAERTYKQRFLYAKLFSHLTSAGRAKKYHLPHFRLNKVRNIKTWLSVRSYLKKRGPQRSVDVIVSSAFIITLLLLSFLSMEFLKDTTALHSQYNVEALCWCVGLGCLLLRFMTLGTKINMKYRSNLSILITEQINLYLRIEMKPHKKEELNVANSVLKLAADLLKELETPFKISGFSTNPHLYTITKVFVLSALSGVLSEMLGFKLKLHKIKIK